MHTPAQRADSPWPEGHRPPTDLVLVMAVEGRASRMLASTLSGLGLRYQIVDGGAADARHALTEHAPAVVIGTVEVLGSGPQSVLATARSQPVLTPVIALVTEAEAAAGLEALQAGALACLTLPIQAAQLAEILHRALSVRQQAVFAQRLRQLEHRAARRDDAHQRFRAALESLYMAWQPVVDAGTLLRVGYEALLRTDDPSCPTARSLLDLATEVGGRHQLDEHILAAIAEDLRAGGLDGTIFVNISLRQLRQGTLGSVNDPLHSFAPRVVLELGDEGRIDNPVDFSAQAERLRAFGYRIALDDVGATGDTLPRLLALSPELLKLDRLALLGCARDRRRSRFLQDIVAMAHADGALVAGEGVEDPADLATARALGCDLLQGYLLGRPNDRSHWVQHTAAVRSLRLVQSA